MIVKRIAPFLIVLLAGLLVYSLFSKNSSTREAKKLTLQLQQKADSLDALADDYILMQRKYDTLYNQLKDARSNLARLKVRLEKINLDQTANVREIRKRLSDVVKEIDSLEVKLSSPIIVNSDLDSLRF